MTHMSLASFVSANTATWFPAGVTDLAGLLLHFLDVSLLLETTHRTHTTWQRR
jgi:hypothetical protein